MRCEWPKVASWRWVDVCGQIGTSEATVYTWKKKYGVASVCLPRKLGQLVDENARFRLIAAELR